MTPQQQAAKEAADFVATFNEVILFPTIALLSGVAFLVFIWGCFEYLINATNEEGRRKGVRHITWGIIGLLVMVSAFSILYLVTASLGLNKELDCANNPSGAGCENVFKLPSVDVGSDIPDNTPPSNPPDSTPSSNPPDNTPPSNPPDNTPSGNSSNSTP